MAVRSRSRRVGETFTTGLRLLLVLGALLAAAFLGGVYWAGQRATQPAITGALLEQQLRAAQELVSMEYHYTNVGRFENQLEFYGWKVPFTEKHFIVSYEGTILAGVRDIGEIEVAVSELTRTVTVTVPACEVLAHEIREDSLEVFDETHNLFNPIRIEDYNGFTRDQKETVTRKAIDSGLLTAAHEKACTAVQALLTVVPGMEEYTLVVR